jgi:hypothetical protein
MAMAAATCAEQDVVAARGTGLDASALDGSEDPDREEVEGGGGSGGGRPGRSAPREGGGVGVELGDELEAVGLVVGGGVSVLI